MRSHRASRFVRLGVAWSFMASAHSAFAEAPKACIDAVESGQSLRDKVKLTRAKAAFLVCASSACPEIIQRDCAQWLSELETRIPTVIVTAGDASGHDVVYVRVLVDGEPFADRLDGIAVPIDPGIHRFRLEPKNGLAVEETVVIREAEKYQKQHFILPAAPPAASMPPVAQVVVSSDRGGYRTGAIVAAAVSGVAAGAFAGFGVAGAVDVHSLDQSCSPRCSASSVAGARLDLQIADVSLGVGVAALAVATWLYFEWRARPGPSQAAARWGALELRF